MNYQEAMTRLEEYGTEQNRKVYKRHGASDNVFGVSFANLKQLKKEIKKDQDLAEQLWDSGNDDARTLATMIADPKLISEEVVDKWAHSQQYHILGDALAGVVAKTPFAVKKAEEWTVSENEWLGRAGWTLLGLIAGDAKLSDEYFNDYLKMIELNLQTSPNRKKEAMHSSLITIGVRSEELEAEVVRVVGGLGPVEIDHGETSCKTPDVVEYIQRTKEKKKKKA